MQETFDEDFLIKAQEVQVEQMRCSGLSPPIEIRPIPTTMVSPVPEEPDEEEEDGTDGTHSGTLLLIFVSQTF